MGYRRIRLRMLVGGAAVAVCLLPNTTSAQAVVQQTAPFPLVGSLPPQPQMPFPASTQDLRPRLVPGGLAEMPAPLTDLFRAGSQSHAPRTDPSFSAGSVGGFVGGYGYFPGAYFPSPPYILSGLSVNPWSREKLVGYLRLLITPVTAQIYADGLYVGSVGDVGGSGVELEEGPHRIELRADGYATLTFDVRILSEQTTTYRNTLQRATPNNTVAMVSPPGRPKTFYVIPGCYAGDRPPTGALPAGCDLRKTLKIPPIVSRVVPTP